MREFDKSKVLNEASLNKAKALNLLVTEYSPCFDRCFPLTASKTTAHNNAWFDKELKNLLQVKTKVKAYKKYLCKKIHVNNVIFNRARNSYPYFTRKEEIVLFIYILTA